MYRPKPRPVDSLRETTENVSGYSLMVTGHHEEGDERSENGHQHRKNELEDVVSNRNTGNAEGQQGDEMHAPNAHAHGHRASEQPRDPRSAPGHGNAVCEVQGGIRSEYRDEDRENGQQLVVVVVQMHPHQSNGT